MFFVLREESYFGDDDAPRPNGSDDEEEHDSFDEDVCLPEESEYIDAV
jgi:hypothetical protein